jgi:hypothetical protein
MDEWMVDRPHDNRFRGVVCESGESKPKRSRLLAARAWIHDCARGGGHIGAPLDYGQDRAQITFGRDPNNCVEKPLAGRQRRLGLGLTEASPLAGCEDGTGDRDGPNT